MQITWHGQYTVKIQTNGSTLVLDPYSADVGLPFLKLKADFVSLSNPSDPLMSDVGSIKGSPVVISSPGEYSVNGFTLHALRWFTEEGQERSVQRWMVEGIVLLHVGALNRDLADQELQEIEKTNIDILFLPVGGGNGLNTKQALGLVTTIEPRIVIPIHYKTGKVKENLETVDQFAKEMGIDASNTEKKLSIKANRLPESEMETVILSA